MKLLVLGGGGFLGYHVVAGALASGHEVSTFSREGAPGDIGGSVERLVGDREGDLSALEGREWDAAVDTFSRPDAVSRTARMLSGRVGAYGFVSGISNYHPEGPEEVDEGSPLRKPGENEDDPLQERSLAKLACERAVEEGFDGSVFVVRPGIMVGPRDPTDRFTWWPVRFARALRASGGSREVLVPGDTGRQVQFTDARDLALWMVRALGGKTEGTFNGVGPDYRITLGEVLGACLRAAEEEAGSHDSGEVRLVRAGEDFLRERLAGVEEEARPLWFPEDQIPFEAVNSSKAIEEAGLRFRPAYETARDTLAWFRSERKERDLKAGFAPSFEEAAVSAWKRA